MKQNTLPGLNPAQHLGTVRQWHWISSALCLTGMLLFAVTGITLNHAGQIEAQPVTTSIEETVPQAILTESIELAATATDEAIPGSLAAWLRREHGISAGNRPAEWTPDDVYVSLPRPGGDAWLSVDFATGELFYERMTRGMVAYLNDLHKGRNTGTAWSWFIDVFSIACVIFSVTGLLLLWRQQKARPSTWPITALGLLVPVLIALVFIHG